MNQVHDDDNYQRRTCPGGYDYAGHDCDRDGCPEGYPRLTVLGWKVQA